MVHGHHGRVRGPLPAHALGSKVPSRSWRSARLGLASWRSSAPGRVSTPLWVRLWAASAILGQEATRQWVLREREAYTAFLEEGRLRPSIWGIGPPRGRL